MWLDILETVLKIVSLGLVSYGAAHAGARKGGGK